MVIDKESLFDRSPSSWQGSGAAAPTAYPTPELGSLCNQLGTKHVHNGAFGRNSDCTEILSF